MLTLLPCLDEETEIRCKIHIVNLDEQPVYDALSYAWGEGGYNATRTTVIVDRAKAAVTPNLGSLLRRLPCQGALRSQHLWVDALCMNRQSAEDWSNHAAGLMASIFQQVREVVIGFGEGSSDDKAGIDTLKSLASALPKALDSSNDEIEACLSHVLVRIDTGNGWSSILGLFERDWWGRCWVIQEIVLADKATLLFGTISLNLTILDQVLKSSSVLSIIFQANGISSPGHKLLEDHPG